MAAAKKSAKKSAAKPEKPVDRTPEARVGEHPQKPADKPAPKAPAKNATHPENKRVPESAIIRREPQTETGKVTSSAEVQGDKAMQIIDNRNNRPVHLSILEGTGLHDGMDGRILVVTNNVSTNVVPLVNAKGLFAVKKDGTVIYNDRGFDDVPNNAEFDLLDIEKLVEHNN